MTQPRKQTPIERVLELVDGLSPEDQEMIRVKLNSKSKIERWNVLHNKVQRQSDGLPTLTDEDIIADVKDIRTQMKIDSAESRH